MGLKIDVFCNDGSPIGLIPPDIYGRGVGGAELALMSWAEVMAQRGHAVRIYNDPAAQGDYDGVAYRHKAHFNPADSRDAFILWRSPNAIVRAVKANIKIHWSTDQYTCGDFGRDIFPYVDKVVCISPFHVDYHRQRYGVENGKIDYLDLGVRLNDYQTKVEKIPGRCIFCSVPDRGLDLLHQMWRKIKERVPGASLVITSDYRLWGAAEPRNHQHRLKWLYEQDVIFLGKVERAQLVVEQEAAVCQPYPVYYDELFCISAAECQVAGAIPVTSPIGALKTTNGGGVLVDGNMMSSEWQQAFTDATIEAITNGEARREKMVKYARRRFDWNKICEKWEKLINSGEL